MEIKDLLRTKRIEKGLTMKELAERVGVSEGTISRWESGEIASMKLGRAFAIAKALDISPSKILKSEEDCAPAEKHMISKYRARMEVAKKILDEGDEVIFDAYELAPDKLTDYARMICMTTGDRRHLATAAHSSASKVPQEDLDQLDD